MTTSSPGPDLALVGAARSGTSLLAAQLSVHPAVDASAVKEPNYFSRHFERGPAWYDAFFAPREPGVLRLDASVSYTYPQHPDAIARLAESSPSVLVAYVVRDPVPRAVSHYLLYRHYFEREPAPDFGAALRADSYYTDVSDYERWLGVLEESIPRERILVVPFDEVTRSSHQVASVICGRLGLAPPPVVDREVGAHQNNVVTFRSDRVRRMTRALRHSGAYPKVRRALGPRTLRRIRSAVTSVPSMPSVEEALSTCDDAQLTELNELSRRASVAVSHWLAAQDEQTGLKWAESWPRSAVTG